MADVGKKTNKQTQAGRDVYETPEGEMVSEKSTTFEYKGKWINIPTIHNGKQYSDAELIEMLEEGLIKPTSIHNKLEEAIQAAQSRSDSLEFNKGGIPMLEKQMELFNEGGLKDEGGEVDPVSGNDVPIGSTKEEVRDDIPAMVSEGEFVFPADVVRYIGLNNLMNMRQEAKMGLKKMEAMGQMGNSEEATLPDDMPFGMADIVIVEGPDEPKEMAQGGVVQAQTGTFVTPMFNPSNQDVREYKNAKGESLFIPFLNGEPVYPIPAGYSPVGQAPTETTPETPASAEDSGGGGGDDGPRVNAFTEAGSWTGSPLDMYIKEADKVTTYGNMASGVGAAFNPLIGGFMAVAVKNEKRKILATIDDRIKQAKTKEDKEQLEDIKARLTDPERKGILSKAINSVFDGIKDSLGLSEEEQKVVQNTTQKVIEQESDQTDDQTQKEINAITDQMLKGPSVGSIDSLGAGIPTTTETDLPSELNRMAGPITEQTFPKSLADAPAYNLSRALQAGIDGRLPGTGADLETADYNVYEDLRASIENIKNPETALNSLTNITDTLSMAGSIDQAVNEGITKPKSETEKQTDTILESAPAGVIAAQPDLSAAKATKDKKRRKKQRRERQKAASKALSSFDKNVAKVKKDAGLKNKAAQAGIKKEADKIKSKLEQQEKGIITGFAKGGLASRRK